MYRGQLVKWNDNKGFGFIKASELTFDTFIHISALKHMARQPKQGDYIHFDVETHKGKTRATNARIEGVKAYHHASVSKTHKRGSHNRLLYVAIVIAISAFLFSRLGLEKFIESKPTQSSTSMLKLATKPMFTCDGRQYCSQMTSRAEAEFFTKHCPNTKMDGDKDGIPCENDTRF
ncbi:cold shock domain-containing protein [Thalassotalea euphylliae]|uniref:Cold shock domain-containing protein n=1 Tax=Thalassotalea euphylliae TaxID=1655234 RepID=A0A3E0TPU9_9GAMM|nr:cold shock domain-containing protein [Thalassotalea euphylliae]REL26606.1 cold shock domain-containing protein [Thalassotalea euphylliae]